MSGMKRLKGRVGLVTGASRGIGAHIAKHLASQGIDLILAARTTSDLEAQAVEIRKLGVRCIAISADVTRDQDLRALVERGTRDLGSIDILVNNAGIAPAVLFDQLPLEELRKALDTNLASALILTRLVLPGMLERRSGHIVNISSLAGKVGPAYNEIYAATKAALAGFTQSIRASYRSRGVSASTVFPGFVSGEGIYARIHSTTGASASPFAGTSTPDAVAREVVRAIRRDSVDAIVNPVRGIRCLLAFLQLFPNFGEPLLDLVGAHKVFREAERSGKQKMLEY